jgi:hypothetical protein
MPKLPVKKSTTSKKEINYIKTINLPVDVTYEERECILRRAIFTEQGKQPSNGRLRFIVVEKTMQIIKINFFSKITRKSIKK